MSVEQPTECLLATLTEDQLRERLVDRFNWLGAKIAECQSIVAGLAALEGELRRVDAALAALNGDHAVVAVEAEPWACDVCPRSFSTRRGLSRHVHAAHTLVQVAKIDVEWTPIDKGIPTLDREQTIDGAAAQVKAAES